MDKRTKILLIVLAGLVLAGGGIFGYGYLTAEKPAPVTVAAKPKAAKPAPAPAVAPATAPAGSTAQAEAPVNPATTAPAAPAAAKAPVPAVPGKATAPVTVVKAPAPAVPGKAPAPVTVAKAPAPAAPGKTPPVPVTAKAPVAPGKTPPVPAVPGKATAPVTVAKAPAAPGKTTPAPAAPPAAAYVPVIKVIEKGKQVQYATPEDFVAKTSLSPDDVRSFSRKGLDDARKSYDTLSRSKGAKDALDRADKDLKMMERLSVLVNVKYPEGPEKVTYSSLGKRDPFMSPFEVPKVLPKVTASMTPLEKNPTETLLLKAVLWTAKGYRALVETPDKRAYTVKVGDVIGNKGGRITRISERNLYVTEKITDILGDIETRNIVLKLHKEAE